MPYALVGGDAAIRISFGQVADGTAPNYGTAQVITGYCRRWSVREDVRTVDVSAPSTTREKHRVLKARSTLTIENFVLNTGWVGFNAIGKYAKVEVKELTSMATFKVYEGIITSWEASAGDAEQVERIEVLCDAEHA